MFRASQSDRCSRTCHPAKRKRMALAAALNALHDGQQSHNVTLIVRMQIVGQAETSK